ncbi:MAG TPA: DUF433 domain-containing protein [Ktedonobacterales bacterium]|nr:DUF433 domain-containing protein [Ktedonobacterales bacterium]
MATTIEHVEERNGEYYAARTRVPVDVVIAAWRRGDVPERIVEQFPSLSLADVYGVITYFLDHEKDLRAHFAGLRDECERARQEAHAHTPTSMPISGAALTLVGRHRPRTTMKARAGNSDWRQ